MEQVKKTESTPKQPTEVVKPDLNFEAIKAANDVKKAAKANNTLIKK